MKKILFILIPAFLLLMAGCKSSPDKKSDNGENKMISEDYQSQLLIELPDEYNTPDGLSLAPNGDLILSVPNFNNQHLLERGMIEEAVPPFMASIDPDNNIEHWYDFKEEDLHPETGTMGPMGSAFGPDGNLYVADMHVFFSDEHKSRLIRINVENGKAVDMDVVATGFIASNGVTWRDNTLFVTESVLGEHEDSLVSGVYAFSLEELSDGKPIELVPFENGRFDDHLVVSFSSGNHMGFGADGITFDDDGVMYTTVIEKGEIYKSVVDDNNNAVTKDLFAKDENMKGPDGLIYDSEREHLYVADFLNNAVHAIDMEGNVTTLHKNGDVTGANGGLDQPAVVTLRGNELIVVNMDMAWAAPDFSVNKEVDGEYNLAVIRLDE